MLTQLDNLTERVVAVMNSRLMVARRRQLLVTYYELIGMKPNKEALTALDEQALDAFCHRLVDYLSTGHFSVYERIISEMSGDSPMIAAAQIIRRWKAILNV